MNLRDVIAPAILILAVVLAIYRIATMVKQVLYVNRSDYPYSQGW